MQTERSKSISIAPWWLGVMLTLKCLLNLRASDNVTASLRRQLHFYFKKKAKGAKSIIHL